MGALIDSSSFGFASLRTTQTSSNSVVNVFQKDNDLCSFCFGESSSSLFWLFDFHLKRKKIEFINNVDPFQIRDNQFRYRYRNYSNFAERISIKDEIKDPIEED